ncbi:MAG: 3-dehydroquinate synthase [Myxococcota bacterium]|nr:3-dehydroquinate synthase [Myxococcota bacterium]
MASVHIELPQNSYAIHIEAGLLGLAGERVRGGAPHARCALVSDQTVSALYAQPTTASLEQAGFQVSRVDLDSGESNKNAASIERLYRGFLEDRLERSSPVIALGGGVVGDMAGFAAATYRRGVPFVQCPTTLLAMVDSSVGGKTGFNVPEGKNLIGAFHQPALVLIDPTVLRTLPDRELLCGIAECVKHAVIREPELFEWMKKNAQSILELDDAVIVELIERNVSIKAQVVMEDEKEHGVRAHLNFGHTFAHAIEATAGYGKVLHGEAVALGMLAATRASVEAGLCDVALLDSLERLLDTFGFETACALPDDVILEKAMRHDKKVIDDRVRLILPEALGRITIRDDLSPSCIRAGWNHIRQG